MAAMPAGNRRTTANHAQRAEDHGQGQDVRRRQQRAGAVRRGVGHAVHEQGTEGHRHRAGVGMFHGKRFMRTVPLPTRRRHPA